MGVCSCVCVCVCVCARALQRFLWVYFTTNYCCLLLILHVNITYRKYTAFLLASTDFRPLSFGKLFNLRFELLPAPLDRVIITNQLCVDRRSNTVSSYSLTMEVEVVTKGDSRTTHAIIFTGSICVLLHKVKSVVRSPGWHVSMFDSHLPTLEWLYSLSSTCRSQGKWQSRKTGRQSSHQKWFASRKIENVEVLEIFPAGTKPRTPHHLAIT